MQMEAKDYITIGISSIAVAISFFSIWLSWNQKKNETERSIRKDLSGILEEITKTNIDLRKLSMRPDEQQSESIINLRRLYTSQKQILLIHAAYLAEKYNSIVTDVDSRIIAMTLADSGEVDNADMHWNRAIEKSISNHAKHINLRSYALFLFGVGKFQQGRVQFEKALTVEMPDNDSYRNLITDTYILWSNAEKNNNHGSEATRLLALAKSTSSRIGNNGMRLNMDKRIAVIDKPKPQQSRKTITVPK